MRGTSVPRVIHDTWIGIPSCRISSRRRRAVESRHWHDCESRSLWPPRDTLEDPCCRIRGPMGGPRKFGSFLRGRSRQRAGHGHV